MVTETTQRVKLNSPETDTTVYSGKFRDRMAVSGELVVYSGVLSRLDFIHPENGQVLDSWKSTVLDTKGKRHLYSTTYKLPTLNGYLSKVCLLARGSPGTAVEFRLQTNGPFPAAAGANAPVQFESHIYKRPVGREIALDTCGNRITSKLYLSIYYLSLCPGDRVVVSRYVDHAKTTIVDRCIGDQLESDLPVMEFKLPQGYPVRELTIDLYIEDTETEPTIDLVIPVTNNLVL